MNNADKGLELERPAPPRNGWRHVAEMEHRVRRILFEIRLKRNIRLEQRLKHMVHDVRRRA